MCYGQSDIDLADTYEDDILDLRNRLPFDNDAVVYSSPFKRCTTLAAALNPNFIASPAISEMHFGDWELQPWDEINTETLNNWMLDFVSYKIPGGENFEAMYTRCANFWDELLTKDHKAVLLVTHAGVIRSILAHVLGIPLQKVFQLQIDYSSISKITYDVNYKNQVVVYINQIKP